ELRRVLESIEAGASEAQSALADGEAAEATFFNSLSWDRKEVAALPDGWAAGSDASLQLFEGKTYAEVDVPSMGWATLSVGQDKSAARTASSLSVSPTHMENEYLAIELNASGEIVRIVDKERGTDW